MRAHQTDRLALPDVVLILYRTTDTGNDIACMRERLTKMFLGHFFLQSFRIDVFVNILIDQVFSVDLTSQHRDY